MIIFYETLTGKPVSTLTANQEITEYAISNKAETVSFIEVAGETPLDFYIDEGLVVELTKPSEQHQFDYETKQWVELPPHTPKIISMRQARLQLLNLGLLDSVNVQINSLSQAAQIEWEYATEVNRNNPLVSSLQVALSMTDSDMDLFFRNASEL
jgi:hypothetical protein